MLTVHVITVIIIIQIIIIRVPFCFYFSLVSLTYVKIKSIEIVTYSILASIGIIFGMAGRADEYPLVKQAGHYRVPQCVVNVLVNVANLRICLHQKLLRFRFVVSLSQLAELETSSECIAYFVSNSCTKA